MQSAFIFPAKRKPGIRRLVSFVRFVVTRVRPDSGVQEGLFAASYALRDEKDVSAEHRQALSDLLLWFETHLRKPQRFNRTSSKGYYRRTTKGIAWFRDTAETYISRMHELKTIAEANGHSVAIIREDRVGYIVYEDDVQVIAEPFADTRTGS
jgi:hypothetical protein